MTFKNQILSNLFLFKQSRFGRGLFQSSLLSKGSPFLNVLFPIWALPVRWGGVKACQDGLGHFFSTIARLTGGEGV